MTNFERLSLLKLREIKASVDSAIKIKRLKIEGLDPREFAEVHSEAGCNVFPVFIKNVKGGGAIHIDIDPLFDYVSDAYEYQDSCKKHNVRSAAYRLLSRI